VKRSRKSLACCSPSAARRCFYGDSMITAGDFRAERGRRYWRRGHRLEPFRAAGDHCRAARTFSLSEGRTGRVGSLFRPCDGLMVRRHRDDRSVADRLNAARAEGPETLRTQLASFWPRRAPASSYCRAVALAITGGEALYADMGFGRFPIRLAWLAVVLPALALNYFGQARWSSGPPACNRPSPAVRIAPARIGRPCDDGIASMPLISEDQRALPK